MLLQEEREKIVVYGQEMLKRGLTAGTFGNLSIYNEKENLFAISPSGMDYFKTDASDVVVMTLDGEKADGDRKPSSEVDMHRIFYQKRPGIKSVVHTHPRYATTLDVSEQIEFCAQLYYNCKAAGQEPKLLNDEQINSVLEAFQTYRQK